MVRATTLCVCATALAVALGVAPAAADQTITLNIPMDLKKLLPEVSHIDVVCRILEDEPGEDFFANFYDRLGYGFETVPILEGSVQQTLKMEIIPEPPHNFSTAKFYACHMIFNHVDPGGLAAASGIPYTSPASGVSAGAWRTADPAEPFAAKISGPLSPDIVQILQGPQTLTGGN